MAQRQGADGAGLRTRAGRARLHGVHDDFSGWGASGRPAPLQTRASELIGGWRTVLEGVVTQHLLGPIDVRITSASADAVCHVRALHYRAGASGGDTWEVLGHYVFALALDGGSWRITKMRLETYHQLGNRTLLSGT